MKKLLLTGIFVAATSLVNGQILEQQTFNSFTPGNLGIQGGFVTSGGSASDYQIREVDAAHGNSLQIVGGATGSTVQYAYTTALANAWSTRTAGNNIMTVTTQFYTGGQAGTGGGTLRSVVYTSTFTPVAGIVYDHATKTIKGIGRGSLNGGAQTNYLFTLGPHTFEPNTWITVSYSYDYSTGRITWTYPGGSYYIQPGTSGTNTWVLNPGLNPAEHDFITTEAAGNTVSHIVSMDNLSIEAATQTILATHEATLASKIPVSMYPNPAIDYVKFSENVLNAQVFDMTGKSVINSKVNGNSLDVKNLKKGVYLIKIQTKDGVETQKLIKK